jgi:6-pyruvoyltetrahydropterin/6-carboxytetrahydropterin synthase
MKAYLTRRYKFPASHRLHSEQLSAAENQAAYGKCNNPHGHGHNYALEVTVSGQVDPQTGMVCNLADLDGFVQREIVELYDHADLNSLPVFADRVPTSENLCLEIYNTLKQNFSFAAVEKVRMEETRKNSFECGNVKP